MSDCSLRWKERWKEKEREKERKKEEERGKEDREERRRADKRESSSGRRTEVLVMRRRPSRLGSFSLHAQSLRLPFGSLAERQGDKGAARCSRVS
jgi:hypothetical protein